MVRKMKKWTKECKMDSEKESDATVYFKLEDGYRLIPCNKNGKYVSMGTVFGIE